MRAKERNSLLSFPKKFQSNLMVLIWLRSYNREASSPQPNLGECLMDNKILQVIVCFFIPPLAVYMKTGKIDNTFWINVVLTILGGVPGLLHALYVVLM